MPPIYYSQISGSDFLLISFEMLKPCPSVPEPPVRTDLVPHERRVFHIILLFSINHLITFLLKFSEQYLSASQTVKWSINSLLALNRPTPRVVSKTWIICQTDLTGWRGSVNSSSHFYGSYFRLWLCKSLLRVSNLNLTLNRYKNFSRNPMSR